MTTAPAARLGPRTRSVRVRVVLLAALTVILALGACSSDTDGADREPVVIRPTEVVGPSEPTGTTTPSAATPVATPTPTTTTPASPTPGVPTGPPTVLPAAPPPQVALEVPGTSPADLARDLGVDGLVGLLDDLIESDQDWAQVIGPRGRDLRDELDELGRRPKGKDVESALDRLDRWLADDQIDAEFGQAVRVVLTELPTRDDGNNAGGNDDDDD